jgi:tetratricopeptide (TPR) repeat protein
MTAEFTAADLRRILRVSESGLRSCLRAALLRVTPRSPGLYSFQDLVLLRTAQGLKEGGVSVRRIRTVLLSLQQQLGEGQGMSSLNIYASGKRVVVWDGRSRWQPDSGQFLLNFETKQILEPARLKAPRRKQPSRAETALTWFERAMALQTDSPYEARRAYQEALRLQPGFVEAHLNLGLLHYNAGDLEEAEICYRRALHVGPDSALAHFNLGVVLEDRQDKSGALGAYTEALRRAPDFREAHCNLAALYEQLGRRRDAIRHYATAKRLGDVSRSLDE